MKMKPINFVLRTVYGSFEKPDARKRTIATAKKMKCDRIMLFNSFGHNEPAHLDRDEVLARARVMKDAAADVRRAGLGAGINNLATVGMNFSPPRKHPFPYQHLVDFDGKMYPETFCPLGRDFQEYIEFVYAAWTSAGPDEVWIDDDFRYKTMAAQCFCPVHLAEFAKMTGRKWTREQVVHALTSNTLLPAPIAAQWNRLQRRGLYELATAIARGVKRTNPATRIAFMGIRDSIWMYGSDYLKNIAKILSPNEPFLIRPEYGGYSDNDRVVWNAYIPAWACHRSFGDDFLAWPELENWPWTGFNHSRKVSRMKVMWAALHGFTSTTVNTSWDDKMAKTVQQCRKDVELVHTALGTTKPVGVSLELNENTTALRPKVGPVPFDNLPAVLATRIGIPLWPDGGHCRILTGNSPLVRARELKQFAKQGMLLDRTAFEMLCAMKRTDIIGNAQSRTMGGIPVEELFANDPRNGTSAGYRMSMEMAIGIRPTIQGFTVPDSKEFKPLWSTTITSPHDDN